MPTAMRRSTWNDALRLLENNDPAALNVVLDSGDIVDGRLLPTEARVSSSDGAIFEFYLSTAPGDDCLARLGDAIGNHTHLEMLQLRVGGAAPLIANNRAFLSGLKRNSSIRELSLRNVDISGGGAVCSILHNLGESTSNLTSSINSISLFRCQLGDVEGIRAFTSALSRCNGITELEFRGMTEGDISDPHIRDIIEAAGGCPQLKKLATPPIIGEQSCDALISLVQDTESKLASLDIALDTGNVNVATALAKSNSLETISVGMVPRSVDQIQKFWWAFAPALCDLGSMNGTYFSNHILKMIQVGGARVTPLWVGRVLDLNRSTEDKKMVAMAKVLRFHDDFDMMPFFVWDLKVLPTVIDWFERAGSNGIVDKRKLFAIYQFIRGMPEMLGNRARCLSDKEKETNLSIMLDCLSLGEKPLA